MSEQNTAGKYQQFYRKLVKIEKIVDPETPLGNNSHIQKNFFINSTSNITYSDSVIKISYSNWTRFWHEPLDKKAGHVENCNHQQTPVSENLHMSRSACRTMDQAFDQRA